jgi:hypothetical protein
MRRNPTKKNPAYSEDEVLDAVGRWYKYNYGVADLKEAGMPTGNIEVARRIKAHAPAYAFQEIVDEISTYPIWKTNGSILPLVSLHRGELRGEYETISDGFHWRIRSDIGLDSRKPMKKLWQISWGLGPLHMDYEGEWYDTKDEAVLGLRCIIAKLRAGEIRL